MHLLLEARKNFHANCEINCGMHLCSLRVRAHFSDYLQVRGKVHFLAHVPLMINNKRVYRWTRKKKKETAFIGADWAWSNSFRLKAVRFLSSESSFIIESKQTSSDRRSATLDSNETRVLLQRADSAHQILRVLCQKNVPWAICSRKRFSSAHTVCICGKMLPLLFPSFAPRSFLLSLVFRCKSHPVAPLNFVFPAYTVCWFPLSHATTFSPASVLKQTSDD